MHGNVKWLCQYIAVKDAGNPTVELFEPRFIDYQYDLLSGKVLQVAYNKGKPDQFFHRYTYDAQNRLVNTETSNDALLWDIDANYQYYPHGPLRRTEIGDDKIQGLDYTYTAQGWLKALNSPMLVDDQTSTTPTDPYKDGINNTTNRARFFPPDVYGMQLHYFDNDFKNGGDVTDDTPIEQLNAVTPLLDANSLFNGNIAAWTERGIKPEGSSIYLDQTLQYRYKYDLLNRIKNNTTYSVAAIGLTSTPAYNTSYKFDRNGNINELKRKNNNGTQLIDDFTYIYPDANIGDVSRTNRLNRLEDAITTGTGTTDFKGTTDYSYDAIGNVIGETNGVMGNLSMTWTPYGKISSVTHLTNPNNLPDLSFAYDAAQNRIRQDETSVTGTTTSTLYVRDAQGNPMATYQQTPAGGTHLTEQTLYGSSRLGLQKSSIAVEGFLPNTGTPLTDPNDIIHLTENNHLLFGLMQNPFEFLATLDQPTPNFTLYPTPPPGTTTTNNVQNTSLAEDQNGDLALVHSLNNNNNAVCYNSDQLIQAISPLQGCNPNAQSIAVPLLDIVGNNPSNSYVVFTIKNNQLYAYKVAYNANSNNVNFIWSKLLTGFISPAAVFQGTFALKADFTIPTPEITVYLRRRFVDSGNDTRIVRLVFNATLFNSATAPTDVSTYIISSTNIGTTFSPYYDSNAGTPEIQLSPNGRQLAVASNAGTPDATTLTGQIRLYDLTANNLPNVAPTIISFPPSSPLSNKPYIRSIDYSPEGKYIYAIAKKGSAERIYRADLTNNSINIINNSDAIANANLPPGMLFLSTVRRGKNGRMYVAYLGKNSVLSITNPDNAVLNTSNIAFNTLPHNALRGNINPQPHILYNHNIKGIPLTLHATQERGSKQYELTDHLGNIRTVVGDIKEPHLSGLFRVPTQTLNNYYPYGMLQSGRSVSTGAYRFGYQGQEADNKIGGLGQHLNYTFRNYDSWGIRFGAVDPLAAKYPYWSPYAFSGNRVIDAVELEGLEPFYRKDRGMSIKWYYENSKSKKIDVHHVPEKFGNEEYDRVAQFAQDNYALYKAKRDVVNKYSNKLGYYDCITATIASMQILQNNYTIEGGNGGNAFETNGLWQKKGLVDKAVVFKLKNFQKSEGDPVFFSDYELGDVASTLTQLSGNGDGHTFFTVSFGKDFHSGMASVNTNNGVTTFTMFDQLHGERKFESGKKFNLYLNSFIYFNTSRGSIPLPPDIAGPDSDRRYFTNVTIGNDHKISAGNESVTFHKINKKNE